MQLAVTFTRPTQPLVDRFAEHNTEETQRYYDFKQMGYLFLFIDRREQGEFTAAVAKVHLQDHGYDGGGCGLVPLKIDSPFEQYQEYHVTNRRQENNYFRYCFVQYFDVVSPVPFINNSQNHTKKHMNASNND